MRKVLWSPWLATFARVGLAGILAWAGLAKLLEDQGTRRRAILAYRIPGLSVDLADVLGLLLPAGEVLLAVALLAGIGVRVSALLTGLLMAGFIVGIISVWVRGYSIDCGCFGGGGDVSEAGRHARYTQEVLRDLLFMGAAVRLWLHPRSAWALQAVRGLPDYSSPQATAVPASASSKP